MAARKPAATKAAGNLLTDFDRGVIRHAAASHRHGWALWATQAAKGRPIERMLIECADAIVNPDHRTLNADERFALSNLLCQVAAGNDVRKALRISPNKVGHRQKSDGRESLASCVQVLVDRGGGPRAACAEIAAVAGNGLTAPAVEKMWQEWKERQVSKKK